MAGNHTVRVQILKAPVCGTIIDQLAADAELKDRLAPELADRFHLTEVSPAERADHVAL